MSAIASECEPWACAGLFICVYVVDLTFTALNLYALCGLDSKRIWLDNLELPASLVKAFDTILKVEGLSGSCLDIGNQLGPF